MRYLGFIILLLCLTGLITLGACFKHPEINPEREEFADRMEAASAAAAYAHTHAGTQAYGPVRGTSMQPLIYAEEYVAVTRVYFHEVSVGKVYLFTHADSLYAHRAIAKTNTGITHYITSGDNARVDKGVYLTPMNLVGEVKYVAGIKK